MRLAYYILAHKNPEQVVSLIHAVYQPNNVYLIHVDIKSDDQIYETIQKQLAAYENIHFLERQYVNWAMWSLTKVQLDAMAYLFDQNLPFDYFINLSGQCYPLKAQEYIKNQLKLNYGNYISIYPPDHELSIKEAAGRQSKIYVENEAKVTLLDQQNQTLEQYSQGRHKFAFGSGWFILTRNCCDFILHSSFAAEVHDYLKTCFISDESYFHTIIYNAVTQKQLNESIYENNRYIKMDVETGGVHPVVYTQDDFIELISSGAWFARKFDETKDKLILKMLDFHMKASHAT